MRLASQARVLGWARAAFRTSAITLIVAILAVAVPTMGHAGTIIINGSLDRNFTDPTGSGAFTIIETPTSTTGLDIRQFVGAFPNFEHRSVVNFSLASSGIPTNAVIQDVTFNFQAESVTSNTGRTVGLFGYAASNTLSLADATAAATLLASYDNWALGLGKHSVDLGPAGNTLLDSLVAQGKPLNLRLQGTTFGTNTLVDSIEMASGFPQFYSAPSITVTFTTAASVPEPSSLVLAGMGVLSALVCSLRRKRA